MITSILWDFDGVILDSMSIRDQGFVEVLSLYPPEQVDKLLDYHQLNGGLSRYVKFRYFFEEIRGERVSETIIQEMAEKFSAVMRKLLIQPTLLIEDSLSFIEENSDLIPMHIVSGSDGSELNYLCEALGISNYFKSIQGSPTPKIQLVQNLLNEYSYISEEVVLIGDSINDLEAAHKNNIHFLGYNNDGLKANNSYLTTFSNVDLESLNQLLSTN